MKSVVILFFSILFMSCSSQAPQHQDSPEGFYKRAQFEYKSKDYTEAQHYADRLKKEHPYSFYVKHSDLLHADILFAKKAYLEASAAYSLFYDTYPTYKSDYVLFQIGESHFLDLPKTDDRDLSSAKLAMEYFSKLIGKFPESTYAQNAKVRIEKCLERIDNAHKYVADFYFKTKKFKSAAVRYQSLLTSNNSQVREEAAVAVIRSYYSAGDRKKCLKYAEYYREEITSYLAAEFTNLQQQCESLDSNG